MDDGDGMMIMELQAKQIAHNATMYKGSAPCPTCFAKCSFIRCLIQCGYSQGCVLLLYEIL